MKEYAFGETEIEAYLGELSREDKSAGTRGKYGRDLRMLCGWLAGKPLAQERITAWKAELLRRGYAARTVNSMLAAVNGFCAFMRWPLRARYLKVQRQIFRDAARDLTRGDYEKLAETAMRTGQRRLALVMETICATGIRVSELRYITVTTAGRGRTDIALKLAKKLLGYARAEGITEGEIFRTRTGHGLSRRQIWYELKRLSRTAGVEASRIFPHNLRHLFAVTFYKASRDIVKLADVLGHSSIETTRIYLISTGAEHQRQLERLGLIL